VPPSPALPRAAVDEAVSAERRHLADLVADLTDAQWATPSLCAAWTVRDVVAHLGVTTRITVPAVLRAAVRARGSFDRMELDLTARRAAAHTTAELVAQLRASADSTRRFPGSGPMDPLMDLVVHAQDVARPLGRTYTSPARVVTASLSHVVGSRFMGAPRRLKGLRLVSTDSSWTHGSGIPVHGPQLDLLLTAAGRADGLRALTGPGVQVLHERLGVA